MVESVALEEGQEASARIQDELRILLCVSTAAAVAATIAARARGRYEVVHAADVESARRHLRRRGCRAILLDAGHAAGRIEGDRWLPLLRKERAVIPIILLERRPDERAVGRALHRGAEGCLSRSPARGELLAAVEMASALRAARVRARAQWSLSAGESAAVAGMGPERQGRADRVREPSVQPYAQAKREALRRFQRRYAGFLLRKTAGNVTAAARLAGVPRQTLHRILRDLGVNP
jgi:DNA-binding NtrC family response regulator